MRLAATLLLLLPIPAIAQTGNFHLIVDKAPIGTASYTIEAGMMHRTDAADFAYTTQDVKIALHRAARFDANFDELEENVTGTIGATPVSYTIGHDPSGAKLNFDATVEGKTYHFDFERNPHTVVFANFDPSAIQVLLMMMRGPGKPENGKFWAFAPIGHGAMIPASFDAAPTASGTLNNKPIALTHNVLKLATNIMDIYSNQYGDLMEARIAAQDVAYIRDGFTLDAAARPTEAAAATIPAGVTERNINFPTDGLTAPGILTLPKGATGTARVPIAVLVQGSGVQDKDATIGANKLFQQLAWALAEQGIATVRYDRRAKFAMADFVQHEDLDHEVVIDAASALAFAANVPEADPAQVYLIGHSLGAELAPYIAARRLAQKPASVRGLVLLAGVATPLDVEVLRQIRDLGKQQGATDEQIQAASAQWQTLFTQARDPKIADSQKIGTPPLEARYWRDLMARDAARELREHPLPTLVLRGENDLNTTHEDWSKLAAASPAPCSKGVEFPNLNHLFMTNKDEMMAGEIAPVVLDDIATWIHQMQNCR